MLELPFDLPAFAPGTVWLVGAGPGDPQQFRQAFGPDMAVGEGAARDDGAVGRVGQTEPYRITLRNGGRFSDVMALRAGLDEDPPAAWSRRSG